MSDRSPIFHSAVFVLLKNDEGKYLLQRRINTGFMDGHYDMSATGHNEGNESIYEAAIRETAEEVGVFIKPEDLKFIMASQMNVNRPYLNYAFICEKWEGEPRIMEPEKCDDLRWFGTNELPEALTTAMLLMKEAEFSEEFHFEYVDRERFAVLTDQNQNSSMR